MIEPRIALRCWKLEIAPSIVNACFRDQNVEEQILWLRNYYTLLKARREIYVDSCRPGRGSRWQPPITKKPSFSFDKQSLANTKFWSLIWTERDIRRVNDGWNEINGKCDTFQKFQANVDALYLLIINDCM